MFHFKLNEQIFALDDWGSPSDGGAEIIEGPIRQWGKIVFGNLEGDLHAGLYAAGKGQFRFEYPYSEHSTVLEGSVTLTDLKTNERTTYQKGDSWIISKGSNIRWHVLSERVVVSYLGSAVAVGS
ncbi:MAG: DUF861 domain-containing protein [Proteobacteria bacterium]|nr:DUF861 domain-containing protein [Pseudomonadota bacterium]